MAQSTESLIWEARARIIWGEKPEKVAEWLEENGVGSQMIDDIIRTSMKERAAEIRKRGFGELLIGLGLIAAGGGGIGAMYLIGVMFSKPFAFCGLAIVFGVFRSGRGIIWLSDGARTRGSVSSLGDSF